MAALAVSAVAAIAPSTSVSAAALDPSTLGMRPSGGFLDGDRLDQYESELDGRISWYVGIASRDSPHEMRSSVYGQVRAADAVLPNIADRINLVMTVPLAFGRGSARDAAGRAEIRAKLLETAAGKWDEDFRQIATTLADGGFPDTLVRLGHEFTGGWYPWSAQGNADAYIAAYRHVHDVMARESGDLRFEWNAARNTFGDHGPAAYPGDAYVDVVGLDVYYEPWKGDPAVYDADLWSRRYEAVMSNHRDFAIAHGKPVSYAEWGLGDVDQPAFIEDMHGWFASLPESGPGRLLYHALFNPERAPYNLDDFPRSKARYIDLFGGGGAPPLVSPAELGKSAPAPSTTAPTTTVPTTTTTTAPTTTVPAGTTTTVPAVTTTTAPRSIGATQWTVFDHVATQTATEYWDPAVSQPADYTSPINLAGGRALLKLDVLSKPSSKAMQPQVCFWRDSETVSNKWETCSPAKALTVTSTGTYWLDLGAPERWWQKVGGYDWSQQASMIRIMFKDPVTGKLFMGTRCGTACYTGDDLGDHVPIRYSGELILVANGAELAPPSDWTGCPTTFSSACSRSTSTTTTVPTAVTTTTVPAVTTTTVAASPISIVVPTSMTAPRSTRFVIDATINAPTVSWRKVSGPSMHWVIRDQEDPTMSFPNPGTYVLEVSATNGVDRSTARVTVTVGGVTTTPTSTTVPSSGDASVSMRSVSAIEGQSLAFKIVLSKVLAHEVVLQVETRDGSAVAGSDYSARSMQVVIPAGQARVFVGVPTLKDSVDERNETMRLAITSAAGATIAVRGGLGTILD